MHPLEPPYDAAGMLPPRNDQVKTLSVHEPMEELRPQAQEELPLRRRRS